jgi:CRISPR-associated protein Cas1
VVRKSAGSLVVTRDKDPDGTGPLPEARHTLIEVEPHRVELIALFGRTHVTSDALGFCVRNGIDIAWFSRNGRYRGRLVPEMSRSADLRLAQYAASTDPKRSMAIARRIVRGKVENAAEVLVALQRNRSGDAKLSRGISDLRQMAVGAEKIGDLSQLLGLEGSAARLYFEVLGTGFVGDIGLARRARRPPPDPANALLSFGYVLLGNLLASLLEARGLDPALGFYHRVRPGRPSLALDLLEELRHPVVDRLVLRLCNLRIVNRKMFEPDPKDMGGVRLTRIGLKRFLGEWDKALRRSLRDRDTTDGQSVTVLLRRQVDRLAADLRGGATYEPFRFRG